MFTYRWYDAIATFGIWFTMFSALWLIDWEALLISWGFAAAGPWNHEDFGLVLSVLCMIIIAAAGAGLIKIRKKNREIVGRTLYYVLVISSALLFQNLYDLYSRLGLVTHV